MLKHTRDYLRSLRNAHSNLERSNFAAGIGRGRFALPYHIVRMTERTGDSKQTVGWEATLDDAYSTARAILLADYDRDARKATRGAETIRRNIVTVYIRDIRTDTIYRVR